MKWAMALLEAHNISESIKPNKPNNNIIIIITQHVEGEKHTRARDMRNVATTGRSLAVRISAAACSASATPCLPGQVGSTSPCPIGSSLTYRVNNVDNVSCKKNKRTHIQLSMMKTENTHKMTQLE
jgi:hypothetical protein